jgi:hypothetical protein
LALHCRAATSALSIFAIAIYNFQRIRFKFTQPARFNE